jgi:hypothetical protein
VEKPSTSNLFALIVCGLFAIGSFALAGSEHILWWAGWFWTAGFLALLLVSAGWKPFVDELEITDLSVKRRFGARLPWARW